MIDPDTGRRAHIDILAERLCVAYWSNYVGTDWTGVVWPSLSQTKRSQWHDCARQAIKELTGAYPDPCGGNPKIVVASTDNTRMLNAQTRGSAPPDEDERK